MPNSAAASTQWLMHACGYTQLPMHMIKLIAEYVVIYLIDCRMLKQKFTRVHVYDSAVMASGVTSRNSWIYCFGVTKQVMSVG